MSLNKRLPSKFSKNLVGVSLIQIESVRERMNDRCEWVEFKIRVSNLIERNRETQFSLFKNSRKISIADFLEFMDVDSFDELRGMLFYGRLAINVEGFQNIEELFFKVKEEELIHDPRKQEKKIKVEEMDFDFNIFE